jgi:choline dehydrogenase-like flavoprotein
LLPRSLNLGGKTKWYGAALLRFGRDEFAADPAYQYRGWPFPYEELKPYYDETEANPLEPRRATIECGRVRVIGRRTCTSVSFGEARLAVFIKAGYDLSLPHHEDRRCRPA